MSSDKPDHSSARSRTVLVTGAASGLGTAIAMAFAGSGDVVHACDISRDRLEAVVAETPGDIRGHVVDVSDAVQIQGVVDEIARSAGTLDVMVNNAGVFDGNARIGDTSLELWRRVIDINLNGCFYGCKAASEVMAEQRRGRIVNISSVAAFRAGPDGVAYSATKAAIVSLTRSLAIDLGPHGVTVNAICPGVVATNLRENSEEILGGNAPAMHTRGTATMTQETLDYLLPVRRRGTPQEVAAAVVFLASADAAYINGAVLAVDGGWMAV